MSLFVNKLENGDLPLRVTHNDTKINNILFDKETGAPAAAMELPDGTLLTGRTSDLLGAASGLLLNALKHMAGLDDSILLMSPHVIEPIMDLQRSVSTRK